MSKPKQRGVCPHLLNRSVNIKIESCHDVMTVVVA